MSILGIVKELNELFLLSKVFDFKLISHLLSFNRPENFHVDLLLLEHGLGSNILRPLPFPLKFVGTTRLVKDVKRLNLRETKLSSLLSLNSFIVLFLSLIFDIALVVTNDSSV